MAERLLDKPQPAAAERMPVVLLSWKSTPKNTLRGWAEVRLGRAMILRDLAVHCAHGKAWARPPSKPQLDGGVARRGPDGKILYGPALFDWTDKEAARRFSDSVIAAVLAEHPHALDDDAGGAL